MKRSVGAILYGPSCIEFQFCCRKQTKELSELNTYQTRNSSREKKNVPVMFISFTNIALGSSLQG